MIRVRSAVLAIPWSVLLTLGVACSIAVAAAVGGDETNKPRTDLYGDPLPPGAVMRLGSYRLRHSRSSGISVVFFSDGKRLISCGCHEVCVWDAATGRLTRRTRLAWKARQDDWISRLSLSPDGKKLAYCDRASDVIELWGIASGRRLHLPPGHDTMVKALAVSADGKILASSDYKRTLMLWDTATGELLHSLAGADQGAYACIFSADGRRMISVSKGRQFEGGPLQVWDVATGKQVHHFRINLPPREALSWSVESVVLSADGKRLAMVVCGQDRNACFSDILPLLFVCDAATGTLLDRRPLAMRSRNNDSAVQKMAYYSHTLLGPDGESLVQWRGDRLIIEDTSTKSLLALLPKDVGDPRVFSANGRLLAAMSFQPKKEPLGQYDVKGLSLIETASGQEAVRLDIGTLYYVAFTPDGRAVVVADKDNLSVWDSATGERLHQLTWRDGVRDGRGEAQISSLAVLPNGRAVTGTTAGDILVWDLAPSTWPARRPTRDSLDALWSDLARDAHTAYRAVSLLATTPARSVALLRARIHPVTVDGKRIENLIADLDDERYEVRETASHELARMSYHAEPILRRTVQGKPTLETRRRLELILGEPRFPSTEDLRTLRAIAVLERIGTPEARHILEKLAGGAASPETHQAKSALQRLNRR